MSRSEMDAAREAGVSRATLRVWVEEGWILPAAGDAGPVFDELDLARARLLARLRDDLCLDDEALPVVLSLIDQVHGLRRQVRVMAEALDRLPPHLQTEIRRAAGG